MPDPIWMGISLAVAALLSGVVVLIGGWPWRAPQPARVQASWVVGQGTGLLVGCWLLGVRPHWPIREDLDRLLLIVMPAVMLVELAAALTKVPRSLIWSARLLIAAGVSRVLLHGTSYLAGSTEAGAWSVGQAWAILAGLALSLGAVWVLLGLLAHRAPGLSLWVCLAGPCAGAALTVMLSGYATGGQIGLPLAGALLGAGMASLALPRALRGRGPVGMAVVGLFSLLVIGRFFGELTWLHAALLLLAPLLGWLVELPQFYKLRPWARELVRVIAVGLVVAGVVVHAQRRFVQAFQSPSGAPPGAPTAQDYLDFGR
jgi:hypothetical protein